MNEHGKDVLTVMKLSCSSSFESFFFALTFALAVGPQLELFYTTCLT
jgi:hypothetical protein